MLSVLGILMVILGKYGRTHIPEIKKGSNN